MSDELEAKVRERMGKARAMLGDASLLLEAGSCASAVNRAYYAVFHASRAMLATAGFEARRHSGVMSEFDRRFVKTGRFDAAVSKTLHALFDQRTVADYEDFTRIAPDVAAELVRGASEFVQTIEQALTQEGLYETDD